jgi:hypothetical protein
MADASRFPHSTDSNPPGWDDAFAALPLEAPPASAWPELSAELGRRQRRQRQRARMALAASLCALAVLPLAWRLHDASRDAIDVATPAEAPSAAVVHMPTQTASAIVEHAATTSVATGDDRTTQARPSIAMNATPQAARTERRAARAHRSTPRATAVASTAQPRNDADASLETLYSASAQLETLLTLTRDTRVESGPAAALAGAFDAELATIDAQLAQPGLAAAQQQALWQARVDTLQQATGFETNQRVLAADGGRLDGALVTVD